MIHEKDGEKRYTSSHVLRAQCAAKPPENETNLLINVSEHISNLKFRLWERMYGVLQYSKWFWFLLFVC